jgi:Peptidase family M23/Ricin-type beta-trefoil lectin domain
MKYTKVQMKSGVGNSSSKSTKTQNNSSKLYMSSIKTFTKLMLCMLCFTLTIFSVINADAGRILNFKTDPNIKSKLESESIILDLSNQQFSKVKPVIKKDKNGKKTSDIEPDTKMSKKQEVEFENCKFEEIVRRSKRNINKITSCRKTPVFVTDELTDQDYNILIDKIQEKEDVDKGLDMTKELPLEEFINIKNLQVCNENISSSNSSTSSSISLSDVCSSSEISSINSSSIIDSSSSITFSSISNSSVNSSTSTNSSSATLESKSSSNVVSSVSSKTGFLNFFFNPIKANAVGIAPGTKVDGYRLPYPKDTRAATYLGMNENIANSPTHNGRNAIDLFSIKNNFEKFDSDIIAAKGGKIVVSTDSTEGFGKHIVIKQDDGHYGIYGHLSSRSLGVNAIVKRADKIGIQGNTGNSPVGYNHLHFEVLSSSVASQTNCSESNTFSTCYSYSTNSSYKIVPQFDECFANRGGADENQCKVGTVNEGYPTISQSYNSGYYWTSINASKPPTFNNFTGTINFYGWQMDVQNAGNVAGNGTFQGTPVQIRQAPNGLNEAQKWFFDKQGKEIKGMNDYCLDAGDSQERLVIWTCNGTNNQKWTVFPNGQIKNLQNNQCINIPNGYANAVLGFLPCNSSGWTQWSTNLQLPGRVAFKRENTNQCLASYSPYNLKSITTQDCNNNDEGQQWEWIYTGNGYVARRFGTNYCLDTYNPTNNSSIYSYDCNWGDAQRWWHGTNKLLSRTAGNSNGQCAAKWNPQNGNNINAYQCNSNNFNDPNLRWDAYGV